MFLFHFYYYLSFYFQLAKDQLQAKFDLLQQRYTKFQEEFSEQARAFEVIGQKINLIGSQMKVCQKKHCFFKIYFNDNMVFCHNCSLHLGDK